MTLEELSRCFKLRGRIDRDLDILQHLNSAASPGSQVLTGMPHALGVRDKVGDLAVVIADMQNEIEKLQAELSMETQKVLDFINTVPDELLRATFRLRFITGMTWKEVAKVLGGRNSAESVKTACYRYLKSCSVMPHRDACKPL